MHDEASYTVFVEPDEQAEEVTSESPVIIAETRVDVPEATVSDAVMMLDLRNTNALLFKNAGSGKHNMVYRRGDGSIGWVEPS
jgi:Sigma 54 modulation/S30EA ribosomal protein C terminus